jgi:hypothetical protein
LSFIHQPLIGTFTGSQEGVWFEDLKDPISEEEVGFYFFRSRKVSWIVRMFVLDRIKMLNVTDERFTWRKDFQLDDFMRYSFKVMHDELYTVRVRISPGWARWVGEKIWHESQKLTKLPDGSLEIAFHVAGLDEIKRWVLSFGPEAQVLEPEKLKEMVRKDLSRILAQYSTAPGSMNLMKEMRAV